MVEKDLSNCPAREGFLPNDLSGCHCFFANEKKGVIFLNKSTAYNKTYYSESNCCNGFVKSRDISVFPNGFPVNQRGRWNWSTTNTKLFRVNGLRIRNNGSITGRQGSNMFPNTHRMTRKQLFSYLSKHRVFLRR